MVRGTSFRFDEANIDSTARDHDDQLALETEVVGRLVLEKRYISRRPSMMSVGAMSTSLTDLLSEDEDPYSVVLYFSNRDESEHILNDYLTLLMHNSQLDEVHVWRSLTDITSESDQWHDVFKYYTREGGFSPKDPSVSHHSIVLMKVDNDVVFISVEDFRAFRNFVQAQRDVFLVHANTVNNGVSSFYQAQYNPAIARLVPELSTYVTTANEWKLSGEVALRLHYFFTTHPLEFAWGRGTPLCITFQDPHEEVGQGRMPTNFFGFRYSVANDVARFAADPHGAEFGLTASATRSGLTECIFMPFVVAHLSFPHQVAAEQAISLYRSVWTERKLTNLLQK
eukprot:TRINITY_DN50281_c0_g1_i1.p1 TRINITY_DN50281_c0_g1~~TRINITY_DN50281_c0_g1_i1.p1  ORF type:complete len:372 (+),score=33.73 TRINITY_DN50281_c0_g1_i1:98-1117(+)